MLNKLKKLHLSMDSIVTVLFFCFGLFWLVKAYEIKAGYSTRVASSVSFTGPYTFPMIIGYMIIVSALINLYISLQASRRGEAAAQEGIPAAERRKDAVRVLCLLAVATLYVLTLKIVGFIPATIVLILVSLLLFGMRSKLVIAAVSVAAPVILWVLFKVIIKVQLP